MAIRTTACGLAIPALSLGLALVAGPRAPVAGPCVQPHADLFLQTRGLPTAVTGQQARYILERLANAS